jgi:RND family efflux transporter MFP subunit
MKSLVGTFLVAFSTLALSIACKQNEVPADLQTSRRPSKFVQTQRIENTPFEERISFLGIAAPSKLVSLHFAVPGRLKSCPSADGDAVKQGELLCSLETEVVGLEIARAQAAVDGAKKVLESNFGTTQKQLYDAGFIGQIDYEKVRVQEETARATLRDATALLELAQKRKAEHALRAPWDGKVSGLRLSAGQLLTPDVTVGFLAAKKSQNSLRIDIKLHASWFGSFGIGTQAQIDTIAGKSIGETITGRVSQVDAAITPETQMFKVAVDLDTSATINSSSTPDSTPDSVLVQGMLVRGRIIRKVTDAGVVIPAASVVVWNEDNSAKVFVVNKQEILELRNIQIDRYSDDRILVATGLTAGERIVSRFAADLYSGISVTFKDSAPSDLPGAKQ